jgi:CheY-like chemotaxis protein
MMGQGWFTNRQRQIIPITPDFGSKIAFLLYEVEKVYSVYVLPAGNREPSTFMSSKILVVEDNADSRNLLHFLLTSKGYYVITAIDGQEGLYMAKVEKPDLIITDLTMPNMDGIELIKHIRSEAELADLPIIIYTSYAIDAVEPAIEGGATKPFYKPIDLDQMIEFIDGLLGPSKEISG